MTEQRLPETTKLWFGKHKGETIRFVLDHYPGYLIWARLNVKCFLPEKHLVREADERRHKKRESQYARTFGSRMNGHPGDYGFDLY